jgi:hypothetical protein
LKPYNPAEIDALGYLHSVAQSVPIAAPTIEAQAKRKECMAIPKTNKSPVAAFCCNMI